VINKNHASINPYTRPGYPIIEHQGVLLHWTACPRATAENIRMAFERNAHNEVYASANYIVGMDGETIEYVPPEEVSYQGGAVARKWYTKDAERLWTGKARYVSYKGNSLDVWQPYYWLIGVEICHQKIDGQFTADAEYAVKELCVKLWQRWDMGDPVTHIWRHTDMTQKGLRGLKEELPCPRWWVEHPEEYEYFKMYVKAGICDDQDRRNARGERGRKDDFYS